jgi:hypothetical protein
MLQRRGNCRGTSSIPSAGLAASAAPVRNVHAFSGPRHSSCNRPDCTRCTQIRDTRPFASFALFQTGGRAATITSMLEQHAALDEDAARRGAISS